MRHLLLLLLVGCPLPEDPEKDTGDTGETTDPVDTADSGTTGTVTVDPTTDSGPPRRDDDGDGYAVEEGDCDDRDARINPGSAEVCNGLDDDCDGVIDEGVTSTYYADADGDGFGDSGTSVEACAPPAGYVSNGDDCIDNRADVFPGNAETCGDGWDNDCDGELDEGC